MPAQQRKNGNFHKMETQYRSATQFSQASTWKQKKFLTVADGVSRILEELERLGVDRQDVVISTNVRTRMDGLPRSGEREPDDPGAAVYWKDERDRTRSMAIDRYTTVADNLAAIAATLEAMRAIERHGGAEILDRAFTGFAQLPSGEESWLTVLEIEGNPTAEKINEQFKRLARIHHPDAGGDEERFKKISHARDRALKELGASA